MTGVSLPTTSVAIATVATVIGSGAGAGARSGRRILLRGGRRRVLIRRRVLVGGGRRLGIHNRGVRRVRVLVGAGRRRGILFRGVRGRRILVGGVRRVHRRGVHGIVVHGSVVRVLGTRWGRSVGIATAASGTPSAGHPLRRDGHVTSRNLGDRSKLWLSNWLSNSSGNLPMEMETATHMRGQSQNRKGNRQQENKLGWGEHDEKKESGRERKRVEREREGKQEDGERDILGKKSRVIIPVPVWSRAPQRPVSASLSIPLATHVPGRGSRIAPAYRPQIHLGGGFPSQTWR